MSHTSRTVPVRAALPVSVVLFTPLILALAAVLCLVRQSSASLPDFVPLVRDAGKAVVNINTEKKVQSSMMPGFPSELFRNLPPGFDRFFDQFDRHGGSRPRMQRSLGTGFIISPDGYIVTNNHVVEGADVVRVSLEGTRDKEKSLPAEIIGTDPETDLALIRVKPDRPLPYLSFGDSDKMQVGAWVLAIGNPFGLGHTVTQGILSAKGRDIQAGPFDNFLQTDASINPGNSGGPLINTDGEVIGINTAIIAGGQGIGFAIPSNMARTIVEQLKSGKKVSRGWMGVTIQEVDANTAKALELPSGAGALIGSVMEGEPADKAGLKAGDVVLEVNGNAVADADALLRIISEQKPGTTVKLTVWRNGGKKNLSIKLGERASAAESGGDFKQRKQSAPALGISVRPLGADEASAAGLRSGQGLLITDVEQGKPGAEAELRKGDIILTANLKPVRSAADLARIVDDEGKKRGAVMLQVQRRGQVFFRTLPLGKPAE